MASRLLLALVFVALVAAYAARTYPVYRAERLSKRADNASLRQASQSQPGNAEYHYRLGIQELYSLQNTNAALAEFRAATRLNPTVAPYWLGLANAFMILGDDHGEQHAVQSALQVDPTTPEVAWRAALFYVVHGDAARALPLFRVVVENDPQKAPEALSTSWRLTHDAGAIMGQVLPEKPQAYLAFIDVLCAAGDQAAAQRVWDKLVDQKLHPEPQSTFSYLWYLYQHHDSGQARRVWEQTASLNRDFAAYLAKDDLITNGGFEHEMLNGGFDWHFIKVPGVRVTFDSSIFHSGTRSLALRYEGGSAGPAGIEQLIPVEGGKSYEFSAFVRSDELVSASGPRLLLSDAFTGRQYVLSDSLSGTQPWYELRDRFTTDANATFLILRIVRTPAEPLIQGSFWVDDVSLVRQ